MKPTRYISFTLTIILALSLIACGGAPQTASNTAPPATSEPETTMSPAEAARLQQEEMDRLAAEELERIRLEEEAMLAALPKLPNIETGVYDIIAFAGYEWRVLDMVDDRVLLISDKILMDAICNPYFSSILSDGIPWASWELREYLNGEFYNSFSAEDREKIVPVSNPNRVNHNDTISEGEDTQDNIFLLSVEEAAKYFSGEYDAANNAVINDGTYFENRIAYHVGGTYSAYDYENDSTEYTVEPGAAHTWWLRSPGTYTAGAAYVDEDGTISTYGQPVAFGAGIRPALWMRLDSPVGITGQTGTIDPTQSVLPGIPASSSAPVQNGNSTQEGANTQNGANTMPAAVPQGQDGFEVMTEKGVYESNEEMRVRVRGVTREMVGNGAFVGIYVRSYDDHTKYRGIGYPGEGETMLILTAPEYPGEYLVCLYDRDVTNDNPVLLAAFPFRGTKGD